MVMARSAPSVVLFYSPDRRGNDNSYYITQSLLYNGFYDAVFRVDVRELIPALQIPSMMVMMTGKPVFTPCIIHIELSMPDTSKSPGPDQLNPQLLKCLAIFLAEPLADLFNNSKKGAPSSRCQLLRSELDLGCVQGLRTNLKEGHSLVSHPV